MVESNRVLEGDGRHHHEGGDGTGDQSEGDYSFFHSSFLGNEDGNAGAPYRAVQGVCRHPFG